MSTPTSSSGTSSAPIEIENFSLEFLCKLIPNEFSGNRYDLGQFIANCNNAIKLAVEPQKIPLVYFILTKITDRAKNQFSGQTFNSWEEIKEKLKSLYQDKKHYCQLMEKLNNFKQKHQESVSDFFKNLELLNSRIISAIKQYTKNETEIPGKIQAVNEIAVNRFVYHSVPRISQMLRWKDLDNLNSAYTAAVEEERAVNMYKTQRNYEREFFIVNLGVHNNN